MEDYGIRWGEVKPSYLFWREKTNYWYGRDKRADERARVWRRQANEYYRWHLIEMVDSGAVEEADDKRFIWKMLFLITLILWLLK